MKRLLFVLVVAASACAHYDARVPLLNNGVRVGEGKDEMVRVSNDGRWLWSWSPRETVSQLVQVLNQREQTIALCRQAYDADEQKLKEFTVVKSSTQAKTRK